MELKEGMYVRTKYGEICKLIKSNIKYLMYLTDIEIDRNEDRACNDYGFTEKELKDIINSSYNIIDLIEVGDYVNGYYVEDIRHIYDNCEDITILNCATGSNYFENPMYDDDIKSIVTKEQFEQMKYEV